MKKNYRLNNMILIQWLLFLSEMKIAWNSYFSKRHTNHFDPLQGLGNCISGFLSILSESFFGGSQNEIGAIQDWNIIHQL